MAVVSSKAGYGRVLYIDFGGVGAPVVCCMVRDREAVNTNGHMNITIAD
jgi:hypothetical protein